MIRRKIRKVIEVRRNPVDKDFFKAGMFGEIQNALWNATVEDFVALIHVYNQSNYCEDCRTWTEDCDCEKCDDCEQKRCVCKFLGDDSKPKDRIRIRKIVWEFVRYMNFGKKYLTLDIIPTKEIIEELYEHKEITKSEADFLKSLTPSSKFPKYTSLMKRLFEIDQ